MTPDKTTRQNRVREALGKIYDQHPPYFREYLRRFQEDPTSRVFAPLAEAYRRLGRVDEAIEICQEGLEHHPDFHGGRVALAKCFLDKHRYKEAKDSLERVVKSVPENLLAQRLLGDAHLALKEGAAALHCYKMAMLLSPNDVTLAEKVHQLERQQTAVLTNSLPDGPEGETPPWEQQEAENPEPEEAVVEMASEATIIGSPLKDPYTDEEFPAPSPFEEDSQGKSQLDQLLGIAEGSDADDDPFKIAHVSAVFEEPEPRDQKEITTETLGDLYFSQGQFDKSLRIFEKLHSRRPLPELMRKMSACRSRLGVDKDRVVLQRKIDSLRAILRKVHAENLSSSDES